MRCGATSRSVRSGLVLLSLLLLGACTEEAPEPSPPPATTPTPTTPVSPAPSETPTPSPSVETVDAVELRAPADGSLLVRGAYPPVESACVGPEQPRLLARYPGTLSVERADDGTLSLTVTLPFDEYLKGIAEVPASWPMAALEAQAVAARSYALATTGWDGREGEPLDEPICATTACQVYRGIPVPPSPETKRWYAAVRRTDGEVLLSDGRPADAVYFSTSNGRTYGNEDVFGSSPLPYLRPVVERDDGASPVSRWRVRIPFEDLERFLTEAGEWPGSAPISDVRLEGGQVVVSGGGETRTMSVSTFRDAVNGWAHCLEPRRYPSGGLPTTIPSRWLRLSSGPHAVVVSGRGWGHGVGMVQWGAYGKARRGLSAAEILAFYYGGLRPQRFPEPGQIHVQVASGLTEIHVRPSAAGTTVNGEALGLGVVTVTGGDGLGVTAP